MAIAKNCRACLNCSRFTTNPVYCDQCYRRTPAGKLEKAMKNKYKQAAGGGPCAACLHWIGHCSIGLPEGGSEYARDCSLLLLQNELCVAIHS